MLLPLCRSIIYNTLLILITIIYGTLCLFALPLPRTWRYRIIRVWMLLVIYLAKVICGIRYQVVGQEHLQGIKNGIIFSKHQSAWETIFLAAYLPQASIIIKRELLYLPFFGWGLAMLNPIAINRGQQRTALKQLITLGQAALQQQRWVIVFPEGTRVAPGHQGHYRLGGAKLAAHSGYPIIPVAHNAGECWPRHGFIKYPGIIKVVFGPPINTEQHNATTLLGAAKTWIETTMSTISQEQ